MIKEKKKASRTACPFLVLGCFQGSALNAETTETEHGEHREEEPGLGHKSLHRDGIVGVAGDIPAWVLAGVREKGAGTGDIFFGT